MIGVKEQEELFELISRTLKKPVECFATGGTAMMYLGFKAATKDIDLIFETEEDRQVFVDGLLELEFSYTSSRIAYAKPEDLPKMLTRGEEFRFDLFLKKVIHFYLSENIRKRVEQIRQFGSTLKLNVLGPEDIILLKCATDREGDLIDAKTISETKLLDWNALAEEILDQAKMADYGPSRLHDFLARLEEKYAIPIPKEVFKKLEKWMEKNKKSKV